DQLTALMPLVGRAGPPLRPLLRPFIERYIARQPANPTRENRQRARFAVTVEAQRGGEVVSLVGTGVDGYGITARIAVLGAQLLLTEAVQRGVRAPAHLPLRPEEALSRVGVEVTHVDKAS
nr:hypothetical protein [Ardenticatenales bacterium]